MLIFNARVFSEHSFHDWDVHITDGRIAELSERGILKPEAGEPCLDAEGLLLLPGLTDIHTHGAMAHDFCDAELAGLREVQLFEASKGVTQFCPTSMTISDAQLERVFSVAAEAWDQGDPEEGAWFCGIHMEGPYVSENKLGAQNPLYVRPSSWQQYLRFQELCGNLIRIVSIAPETEGALDFIEQAKDTAVMSIAHTTADYETSCEAIRRGARHVTHLFNAMPPLHHREPGVIGAAFDHPEVSVEVISDGVHLHPAIIRLAFTLFKDRVCLISDSMRACGLEDGEYDLGGQAVEVRGNTARLHGGSIAGSVTHLADCLRFAVSVGVPLEDALYAASEYPARVIGIEEEAGVIKPGRRANLILSDAELNFKAVLINGKKIHEKG